MFLLSYSDKKGKNNNNLVRKIVPSIFKNEIVAIGDFDSQYTVQFFKNTGAINLAKIPRVESMKTIPIANIQKVIAAPKQLVCVRNCYEERTVFLDWSKNESWFKNYFEITSIDHNESHTNFKYCPGEWIKINQKPENICALSKILIAYGQEDDEPFVKSLFTEFRIEERMFYPDKSIPNWYRIENTNIEVPETICEFLY